MLSFFKRLFSSTSEAPAGNAPVSGRPDETAALTPVERAAGRYLHCLPPHGIREGHVPTAQEVELLADDMNSEDVWPDALGSMDYAALWVDRAPAEALESLLTVLDSGRPVIDPNEGDVDDSLIVVLGHWGQQRLHPWLEEMAMRLDRPRSRAAAFAVLGWNPCAELFPLLAPWLPRVNELTEPEQLVLISLFGDVKSPQSLPALKQIDATLREPSDEVRSELKGYIKQHEERA